MKKRTDGVENTKRRDFWGTYEAEEVSEEAREEKATYVDGKEDIKRNGVWLNIQLNHPFLSFEHVNLYEEGKK